MNKILIIPVILFLIIGGLRVQGFSKQNYDSKLQIDPGDYYRFIYFDGRLRSYRIHIPPSYNDNDPMPLVFNTSWLAFKC